MNHDEIHCEVNPGFGYSSLLAGCTDYERAVNKTSVPASFGGNPSDTGFITKVSWKVVDYGGQPYFYLYQKSETELALMNHYVPYGSQPEEWEPYQEIITIPVEKGSKVEAGEVLYEEKPYVWPQDIGACFRREFRGIQGYGRGVGFPPVSGWTVFRLPWLIMKLL